MSLSNFDHFKKLSSISQQPYPPISSPFIASFTAALFYKLGNQFPLFGSYRTSFDDLFHRDWRWPFAFKDRISSVFLHKKVWRDGAMVRLSCVVQFKRLCHTFNSWVSRIHWYKAVSWINRWFRPGLPCVSLRFSSMSRRFKFMVGGKFLSDRRGEKKICSCLKGVLCWIKATTWECAVKNQIQATKSPFTKLVATHQGLHVTQRPNTQKRRETQAEVLSGAKRQGKRVGKARCQAKLEREGVWRAGKGRSQARELIWMSGSRRAC